MANTVNKYGRQIFLSRQEIQDLRDLVSDAIIGLADTIHGLEEMVEDYGDELEEAKAKQARLEKLIDKDKGKLWYYISTSEAEERGL